jgi:transcriptional regulator with XRE-family HTH domain
MTKLAILRREKRISQSELATLIGTVQPRVSSMERGCTQPQQVRGARREKLEQLFGRPIEELLEKLVA